MLHSALREAEFRKDKFPDVFLLVDGMLWEAAEDNTGCGGGGV